MGVFGRAPLQELHQLIMPNASSSSNSNSRKNIELGANFIFFLELLKGCFKTPVLHLLVELGVIYPSLPLITQHTLSFLFFLAPTQPISHSHRTCLPPLCLPSLPPSHLPFTTPSRRRRPYLPAAATPGCHPPLHAYRRYLCRERDMKRREKRE